MKLVWKLLRQNISKPQLIGFFIANLIGMSIVLVAIQFYFDINPLFSEKDNLFKKDYLTIMKKVGLVSSISSNSTTFSPAEIDDLKKQSFVKEVGVFTASQFNVLTGITDPNGGRGFKTEMFFESVPDQFVDVKSKDWHFSPGDNDIPIILPKNYLDIYNFGFAEANSMPKLSEGLIGLIQLDVSIYGRDNKYLQMNGRIVGFSNRINTILVPEGFLQWANADLGTSVVSNPSRLIVEVDNIADSSLSNYLKEKGYEVSGDNTSASKMSFFLKILVSVVISIGLVICILSFFILILSIYLLLEKNMTKLHNLRLIGYSKSLVVRPYELLVVGLDAIILVISFGVLFVVRSQYLAFVNKLYTTTQIEFPLYTILIGFMIFVLLSLSNILIIRAKIK